MTAQQDELQATTIREAVLLVSNLKELYRSERDGHRREHDTLRAELIEFKAALKEKLEEMNNLRDQVTAEREGYVTRDRLASEMKAIDMLEARVAAAEQASSSFAERRVGSSTTWGQVVTVILLVFQAVGVFVVLYRLH